MPIRTVKDLGAAIRQARKRRGLTQTQLATLLGIRQAGISDMERGSTGVAVGTILRTLAALGATLIVRDEEAEAGTRPRASKRDR